MRGASEVVGRGPGAFFGHISYISLIARKPS
jgi:hypothetical protein